MVDEPRDERDDIALVSIEDEMQRSYLDYAMSVIVSRALPNVRDGLKPVHRRILYTMHENGQTHDRPYRKCATAVGDVMGRYHPHGDETHHDGGEHVLGAYHSGVEQGQAWQHEQHKRGGDEQRGARR